MDVKILAGTLLTGHIISLVVTLLILGRQVNILKKRPDPELKSGRFVLFILAAAIGLGNLIPIAIDTAVIFGQVQRAHPSLFGLIYALSNVLTLILSSSAVLALYVIAERLYRHSNSQQ